METGSESHDTRTFLKSLGFPEVRVHHSFNHFDFSRSARRILVIGSMGSGKTEFSARIWRDSEVARRKTGAAAAQTRTDGADRRIVFFIRSALDATRFPDYPPDALPYRGGYVRCGKNIAAIADSFDLERVMAANPEAGTWVIDEASFYEERLAYVVEAASRARGLTFIFPSLVLNFRREIFNTTARLLLDTATDVSPSPPTASTPSASRIPSIRTATTPSRVRNVPRCISTPPGHRRGPGGQRPAGAELLHALRRPSLPARARSTPSWSSSRWGSRPPAGMRRRCGTSWPSSRGTCAARSCTCISRACTERS